MYSVYYCTPWRTIIEVDKDAYDQLPSEVMGRSAPCASQASPSESCLMIPLWDNFEECC